MLILTNTLMLIIPYISKIIVDLLESDAPLSDVGFWALAMVVLSVAAGVFRFLTRRTIIWMSRKPPGLPLTFGSRLYAVS